MNSPEALDVSKENIQPLRQGRIASQLSAALQAQTDTTILQNLVKKRQEYELLLRTYAGDDPLSIWFEYVEWVEQSFPKDGKEGNLMTLLQNCLTRFKDSVEYFQDIRLVKLWIKYLEKLENPLELYSQLHCHGIGSQCALFYRCWANELYENDDFKQANKVLLTGIGRNAQPKDELTRALENFQIAVARRVMNKSLPVAEENTVGEERKVGNVLTTFGKKHKVTSVRIGGRVKSSFPGTLHSKENLMPQRNVDPVNIYEVENDPEMARSVNKMQTVPHLEILKKENTKKPTPWSGVKQKSAYQFHPSKPSFQVLTDENAQPEPLSTVMFLNALKPKKKDDGFNCPIAIFEVPNPNQQPMYPKEQVYAGGTEYSPEELKAVRYMKHKEKRNKELFVPGSPDAVQMEITMCNASHTTELEKLNPLTGCVSDNSRISTSKKESNTCSYSENNMFHHKQQLSVSGNSYEKCVQTDASSKTGSECYLGDKLPGQPSMPNIQYQHCVEELKHTDSAPNNLIEMDKLRSSVGCSVLTPIGQCTVDGSCSPENTDKHCSENTDTISSNKQNSSTQALVLPGNEIRKLNNKGTVPTTEDGIDSLNEVKVLHSENGDTLSSDRHSSGMPILVAEDLQQNINQTKFSFKSSGFSVFPTGDIIGAPETVKAGDFLTSLNKEEISDKESAEVMLSNKPSSCMPTLLGAENCHQEQINCGKSSLKSIGFSVFTSEDSIVTPETVEAGGFFAYSKKEDTPYSENTDIMLSSEPTSCTSSVLVAQNMQQKPQTKDTFSVKASDFPVSTTAEGTDARETIKIGDTFTHQRTEAIVSPSDHTSNIMLSNKLKGLSSPVLMQGSSKKQDEEIHKGKISENGNRILEFPIFSDEENCYANGQGGPEAAQENGFSGFPNKIENFFSHSVVCASNKKLHDNVTAVLSTTKKNKLAPFQLFIDDVEVPEDQEPSATKRELFKDAVRDTSEKLCCVDSKENMALPSLYTPTNRHVTEKREIKACDNVVTASMIKLRPKKATEQMKEPAAEELRPVTPATMVSKKSEVCAPPSISATSEEVLEVINECWASPPRNKRNAGNLLSPEPPNEPEDDKDFQHDLPVKLSALFPENKENALPQCTKQNVSEPANTFANDDWFAGQLGEPRALDDTCCTLMFSKTLISSTPNRKSGGTLGSDSSDTSPPDSQEFKIPRRCTPLQAERFIIMPRPDALSVIMESSKENKSQSSSGSSSGGKTTHHTVFSLVSPQTENTRSALEMQPPCEAHAVKMTRSLPPHDEGDSSI